MKSLLKKSLTMLGVTVCAVSTLSSVSYASIAWDSDATWTGIGGKANVYAYTAQTNEPYNYKMTVEVSTNDGTYRFEQKNPAAATDTVSLNYTTSGAVSSGTSYHEWIMVGESGGVSKNVDFHW
ncbi:hypothetical protein [Paenibacillus forsythiae]|nr:hypothetical protein [Paenibacillus forsythiae]